ncbi:MAG: sigma-54-dependent Fis family transcriptional regulator [Rhodobacteraceae bacterium]|nr:MAG: sigma-54-dependent Fis family transcriptional regulator [Paracoccaceae bacterium]
MQKRISLIEAYRRAPGILERGDSQLLNDGATPTLSDLADALQFALGDGRIWLNDERMVLMHTNTLGALRKDMIDAVGLNTTRKLFQLNGWLQGIHLAKLVTKRFKQDNLTAALAAGPRLHTMKGFARIITKRFEFDVAKQYYRGEFHWFDSTEADEHLHHFGTSDCPACWMQAAVPSGFSTTLLGFPVIFREIECIAKGSERCVLIGKDAKSWDDDLPELELFGLTGAKNEKTAPWSPPRDVPKAVKPVSANDIVGRSTSFARAHKLMERVAPLSEPVLFLGENGTGKMHFVRRLHQLGDNSKGPFIQVNCTAFSTEPSTPDQSMFGQGGFVDQAKGGSLFLNDVLSLPPALQARLSMLLQNSKHKRGAFRLISATGESPLEAVTAGKMRADLYYHLSLLPITIPPLRERRDDLPALIDHFTRLHSKRHRRPLPELSGSALDLLLRYDYPGNVRELSNMIERGVIYAEPGAKIETNQIFTGIEKTPQYFGKMQREGDIYRPKKILEVHGARTMQDIETDAYILALDQCDWNISAAARKLGLTRAQLDYRIVKLKLR